jgi:hypothetical protein
VTEANAFIAVNGHRVRGLSLRVAPVGPWVAEVDLTEPAALSGRVQLSVGDTVLSGTVIAEQAGTFALQTSVRIVGGAGGWGKFPTERGYHNDAGIKASLLAQDIARDVGETLGTFAPSVERVGVDYARSSKTAASTVLEYAAGGAPWWVDYAGVTHVGVRSTVELPASSYVLQFYNARERVAQLAIDDISQLQVGSIMQDERLESVLIVHDFEVSTRDNSPLRASVWFGGLPNEASRLAALLRSIITHAVAGELHGCYRYRVVTMNGDGRCDLQAVRKQSGLPDLRSTPQWPGLPGSFPTLALGTEVIVQFVDSDPSQPLITNYVGPGGSGYVPQQLVIGGATGLPAARQGDSVQVLLPPAQFAGTINGLAATGVVSWLAPTADGTITGGSGKVRIAT